MNRRSLIGRALALLGVGVAGVALVETDPGFARVEGAGLGINKETGPGPSKWRGDVMESNATWRDLRGGVFWKHLDGWSWTTMDITRIEDGETFFSDLLTWYADNARDPNTRIGVDLRTYDILVRRKLVDKFPDGHTYFLGRALHVVNAEHFIRPEAHEGFAEMPSPKFPAGRRLA